MNNIHSNNTLISKYRAGDREAFDELISNNMGLVKSTAKRFIDRGTEYDDLVQIGVIGLIKAANCFDPELGYEFSTYAFSKIFGEIRRHFRDDGLIKVSRSIKKYCAEILRIKEEYCERFGEPPSMTYLAEKCGITREEAALYIGALSPIESMNNSDEEGMSYDELCGCDNISEFIESYALKQAVSSLTEKEQLVVHLRYDLSLTQSQTAQRLSLNQVKISRMEKKIMEKLRKLLAEQ